MLTFNMYAELKSLISPDLHLLEQTHDQDDFGIYFEATIGSHNEKGEEIFGFQVCSPKWLANKLKTQDFLFGKSLLIVEKYDIDHIKEVISNLCKRTTGENWHEIAIKLSRYGSWEFEDYRELGAV